MDNRKQYLVICAKHVKSQRVRVLDVFRQEHVQQRISEDRQFLVDSLPDPPDTGRGEQSRLYVNPTTREVWYEVEARPLTPEEEMQDRLEKLEARVARLESERK